MYQTVIILLVTAVVTIITTIITVRFTMLGRVLSQSASDKLKTRAREVGIYVWIAIWFPATVATLVYYLRLTSPITRGDVFMIAFLTCMCGVWISLLTLAIAFESLKKALRKAFGQISD
jgi:hypothetical protein